ncbi:putative uncharacterized membrane protein [Clavispora lusitaniae]|uniref:Uncharacterized membrane protein n=1 Tax=Clavispora lusitaniae TaxID=36911 RepID=A0ACD0WFK4_CLALS|nr:Major Facilitator Superfamily protein [Clavispora lusitaniae]QFZ26053.1 putative uncharacterized membrane protein [Clavispora lusitaniae]QFZ30644.1 putative uncharacterized membrane protein [Clavispora lusitaniae]QFZ36312.1 putative uncharacterized membrane protein [Clavispora lusitaniae]QFZ41996.1 putative uncharacterized membrane protein [Clavispora lusitaniae]
MPSFREEMKGFPLWQMSVVLMIRFSEPLSFTSLFPYVYFMVRDFQVTKDPTQISRYTGYMAASFAFAQFLCCIHWGRLSDRIGRKPVLMCGLLGTASSILLFGFSTNYYMALLARTAAGALNGNIAVLQTMVGEITTQKRHQSIAFSMLPFLWNVGCFVGPLIGGSRHLTRPRMDSSVNASSGYDHFVSKHPYAMSNVVVASFLVTSAIIGFLFLEETHYKRCTRYDPGLVLGDSIRRRLGYKIPRRPWEPQTETEESAVVDEVDEYSPLITDAANGDEESINSMDEPEAFSSTLETIRRYSSAYSLQPDLQPVLSRATTISVTEETRHLFRAFRNKNIFTKRVVRTIMAYFCISFHSLIFTEFMPVFLAGSVQTEYLHFPWSIKGGFGWDTERIGRILSTTGVLGCFFVIVVFPYLDKNLGTTKGFRLATSVFPLTYTALPFTIFTMTAYNPNLPPWLTQACLYACTGVTVLGTSLAFPQVSILVYNATNAKYRTFVNSSAMSATSLARFMAPLLWGTLISYFDKKAMGAVPWILLAAVGSCTFTIAMNLEDTGA